MTSVADDFAGWVPIRVYWHQGRPMVDWCALGARRFDEPFFEQTVEDALQRPFHLLFRRQTPLDALVEIQALRPGLAPSGFIFHMSRCGSTLVSQLLKALPGTLVVAEAAAVEGLLRTSLRDPRIDDEQRAAWLRGLLGALSQPRAGQEWHFVVKFDSWHTLDLPLIRRAFPLVPWVFVYRDPVEVLVSNLGRRAGRMLPGPVEAALLGLDLVAAFQMPTEEYCARALAAFCAAALDQRDERARLLSYRQLPDAAWTIVAQHFAIPCAADDRARLADLARRDSKDRARRFADDSAAKQRAASEPVRELADRLIGPLYARLEAVRGAS